LLEWAHARIDVCRRQERKFFGQKRAAKYATGDVGICAVQERRTLQAVLRILGLPLETAEDLRAALKGGE